MINKIALLQARLIGLRSTIHNEKQLSAIELMAMVSKKTNEIIDVVNELAEEVKNGTGGSTSSGTLTETYDPTSESLNLGVN